MKQLKLLLILCICYCSVSLFGQTNCEENIQKAQNFIKGDSIIIPDYDAAFELLLPCAGDNNGDAQYILGVLNMKGLGVTKDEERGHRILEEAFENGSSQAGYSLGRLYKEGIGCQLNYNTALDFFKKSADMDNDQAAYMVGYMYYKGLGDIDQDYNKAVEWFQKSTHPMAKHWLAVCTYFGYGISKDEVKAIAMLENNPIENSQTIVQHFINQKQDYISQLNEEQLDEKLSDSTSIAGEAIPNDPIIVEEEENSKITDFYGTWKGKLIEFDWSGKNIQRVIPITIALSNSEESGIAVFNISVGDSAAKDLAIHIDNTLYFKDLVLTLDRLYTDNQVYQKIMYKI